MADDPLRLLLNCGRDFRDARNHKGEYAFKQWRAVVSECNSALRQLWDDGWLRTIPGIHESESNFPISLVSKAWLSHRLIGFDDFEMNELGSWYFMPGLIHQDPIFICNEFEGEMADRDDLPSFDDMWDRHGFMILGRYASACELIVEIVNREMASQSNENAGGSARVDGVYRSDALLIWGGVRYEWLTDTMMDALELLVKRYPGRVTPSEMENRIGRLPEGGFKKVFKFNRGGKTGMHPVVSLIIGRHPQGWSLTK